MTQGFGTSVEEMQTAAKHVLATYLQPVIAMQPDTLNAGMRSVREEALAAVGK